MKNLLEDSIWFISIIIVILVVGMFVGFKPVFIISIIYKSIQGILYLLSARFYETYIKIFRKEKYIEYHSSDAELQKSKRKGEGWSSIIQATVFLAYVFSFSSEKKYFYREGIVAIVGGIIALLNSLLGVFLYKKFKNHKQYEISTAILIGIFVLTLWIIYSMVYGNNTMKDLMR